MLCRVLRVKSPTGKFLEGTIAIGNQERTWSFTPPINWMPGKYALVVDNTLEDLAGNSIGKMFDVDVFGKPDEVPDSDATELDFEIK